MDPTPDNSKEITAKIVREYRRTQGLTLQAMADAISAAMPVAISRQNIFNWEKALNAPSPMVLIPITMKFNDWRRDFAFDLLAALHPDLYAPAGEIGRKILDIRMKAEG